MQRLRGLGMVNVLGLNQLADIYDIDVQSLKATTQVRPLTLAREQHADTITSIIRNHTRMQTPAADSAIPLSNAPSASHLITTKPVLQPHHHARHHITSHTTPTHHH